MNLTNLNGNRCLWKTVKPFSSDKGSYTSKINLVDKNETFSKLFEIAVKNLGISEEVSATTDIYMFM